MSVRSARCQSSRSPGSGISHDLSEYLIGNEIINHHVGKRLSNPVALRAVIGKLHKAIGIEKERSIHKSEMLFKTGVVRSPWTGCSGCSRRVKQAAREVIRRNFPGPSINLVSLLLGCRVRGIDDGGIDRHSR